MPQIIEDKTNYYLNKFHSTHGNTYDYRYVNNINSANDKIDITCSIHGLFSQRVASHYTGAGCPKCGILKCAQSITITNKQFIDSANKIHNFKYDYSLVNYIKSRVKVDIICPMHG